MSVLYVKHELFEYVFFSPIFGPCLFLLFLLFVLFWLFLFFLFNFLFLLFSFLFLLLFLLFLLFLLLMLFLFCFFFFVFFLLLLLLLSLLLFLLLFFFFFCFFFFFLSCRPTFCCSSLRGGASETNKLLPSGLETFVCPTRKSSFETLVSRWFCNLPRKPFFSSSGTIFFSVATFVLAPWN